MAERIFLKDYQKPPYLISKVDLQFDLDEQKTLVHSKLKIQKQSSGPLKLNGVGLKLLSIYLNGQALSPSDYSLTDEHLILPEPRESEFELAIFVEINPSQNTSLEGLYLSQNLLCTQCEAEGFRKITYFIDRPDVLSQFQVTLRANLRKFPVLLGNGNRTQAKILSDGRHEVTYIDPSKKPCYLFALVAGNLGKIEKAWKTKSGRPVQLEVYSKPGTQEQCHYALEALARSMKWDEDRFGLEYDLDNYMIVAVDDFNAGAMENKGLNIFNSKLVFADPQIATDDDYYHIESVVGHEYFHNWTGNRVTLRDWFQLSLKEGLTVFRDQEFSGDMTNRSLQRLKDVESLWKRQFPEDGSPSAHPIRPESCLAVDNFFTPTIYEKGAEVIRMIQTFLGRPLFVQGLQHYLKTHDGSAATVEDFIRSFEIISKKDLSQIMSWYQQFGTPTLFIEEHYDISKKILTLQLEQKLFHLGKEKDFSAYFFPVEVQFYNQQGKALKISSSEIKVNSEGQSFVEMKEKTQKIQIENLSEKPVISWLRHYSAPVFLKESKSFEEQLLLLKSEDDFFQIKLIFQKLMQRFVIETLQGKLNQNQFNQFATVMGQILESKTIPHSAKAAVLAPLEDQYYLQAAPETNIQDLKLAVSSVQKSFALLIQPILQKILVEIEKGNLLDIEKAEERSFCGLAWHYLSLTPQNNLSPKLQNILQNNPNMTLVDYAFRNLLNDSEIVQKNSAEVFFQRYSGNALTLNKWFSTQALGQSNKTFQTVQELTKHSSFNIKNPNNVYALLRNFGQNLFQFHQGNSEVYRFYLEQIKQIDQMNPQVAARLCSAFQITPLLPPVQRQMIGQQISDLLKKTDLSKNTLELLQNYI